MLKNKRIVIFGLGKSGIAAAKKLALLNNKVAATDTKSEDEFPREELNNLRRIGVNLELGGHSPRTIDHADMIVVSPGIRPDIPMLEEAKKRGIPIISEIELASYFISKPIIAITGTNGKTTTTTLIGEMLKTGGKKAAVAGNIGNPLIAVDDASLDYIVAEISSYQLETIDRFKPWISVILNIQPDHLERHRAMEEYVRQKAKIFKNQTGDDYVIYNLDDPKTVEMVKSARAAKIGFSKANPAIITLPVSQIKIPGKHNLENALAAAQTVYLCGISRDTVAQVLRAFPGVPHRIEFVVAIKGVQFYNDSKGTNPDSTLAAIDAFPDRGIILILGGKDKGVSLECLVEKIKQRVKTVVLIGEAASRFGYCLKSSGYINVDNSGFSLADTVARAYSLAEKGDIVLFSPACASFDMFKNFEERGDAFKQICQKLAE